MILMFNARVLFRRLKSIQARNRLEFHHPAPRSCLLSLRPPKSIINKNSWRYQTKFFTFFARFVELFRLLSLILLSLSAFNWICFDFGRNFFQLFFFFHRSRLITISSSFFLYDTSMRVQSKSMKTTRQQLLLVKHQKNIRFFYRCALANFVVLLEPR